MYYVLELELDKYITDLLCFGFQSPRLEILVMKEHIVRYLLHRENKITNIVKKVQTKWLYKRTKRFFNIVNFLCPARGILLTSELFCYWEDNLLSNETEAGNKL